jgi:transposase
VRRKFFDLQAANPHPKAQQALVFIQALYDVERQARALTTSERAALRQTQAQPQLESMFEWLTQTRYIRERAAAKSGLSCGPLTTRSNAGRP